MEAYAVHIAIAVAIVAVLALLVVSTIYAILYRRSKKAMQEMEITASRRTDELKEQSQNARIASQAKSDFLARTSHEIRTPLNTIIGMTQLAQKIDEPGRVKYYLANIESSSEHLLGIVDDILDFSKLESNKIELEEKLFSLKEDIVFVANMFHARVKEKGLELYINIDDIEHDGLITDSLRLNQVLMNLLSNAVKFTDKGSVSLTVNELYFDNKEGVYRFTVSDTGIGIDPQKSAKLFTSFTQAGVDTTRLFGGTGLGLAISKNLVALLGGEIELETEPGFGSAFSFSIRVKAQKEASLEPKQITDIVTDLDLNDKRILVVDDVELNREIISAMLEETGATLQFAEDGKQALDIFSSSAVNSIDMVLMDLQMPIMDGYTAVKQIRALQRPDAQSVIIIAVSAFAMQEDIERAKEVGMNDYLVKPIDMKTVFAKIGGWFESLS